MKLPLLLALLCLPADAALQEPTVPAPDPQGGSWRILVTNDDGIDSPHLAALVNELDALGEVVVSAPARNRSGSSRSTEMFGGPLALARAELAGADQAWSLDGSPADACAFGVVHLGGERGFDLVVSGINGGSNVGEFAYISGTIGAALEAAAHGVPAIAVSMDAKADLALAARYAADFARALLERGGGPEVIYTINVPRAAAAGAEGAEACPVGPAPAAALSFLVAEDGATARARIGLNPAAPPAGSDTAEFAAGRITVTPLRRDWTDREALAALADWLPQPR
jgi:5'/3'-nucleotidase SurE